MRIEMKGSEMEWILQIRWKLNENQRKNYENERKMKWQWNGNKKNEIRMEWK